MISVGEWVWYRGGFAFVTLNIAVENIRHPSVSEQKKTKQDPSSVTKNKGSVTYTRGVV